MTKLWNKGYDLDKEIEEFTVGDDPQTDLRLVKYDILVNKAHAKMLKKVGILNDDELRQLLAALEELQGLAEQGKFMIKQEQEDVHTAVEAFLTEKLGDIGKKIHTARSRNDQVAADLALYQIDALGDVLDLIKKFVDALDECAHKSRMLPMPGYTHMQKAMPFNVYGWLYGFRELIEDDILGIGHALEILDKNPLGSGAGYGVPIDIDKDLTTKELGFGKCFGNPLSVQQSRGKTELSTLSALNQVMLTLNKLATDLMLFTTAEFGFFSLPDEFCTGSSIMPQKKNYDLLELARARSHLVQAKMFEVQSISSNLPSGYNRDFQLLKKPLMEGIDTAKSVIKIMTLVLLNLETDTQKLMSAMTPELYATDKALKLVQQGVPFRNAYKKVAEELKKE